MPKFVAYVSFSIFVALIEILAAFVITFVWNAIAIHYGWNFTISFWPVLSGLLLFTLVNLITKDEK